MLNSKFKRDLTKQFKKDFKLITVNEFQVGISCVRILNDDGKDGRNKDREDGSNLRVQKIMILMMMMIMMMMMVMMIVMMMVMKEFSGVYSCSGVSGAAAET